MILLVQFRTDQSGWHEIKCIYEAGGVPFHHYSIVNAVNDTLTPADMLELAEDASMVVLGGAGEGGYEAESDEEKAHLKTVKDKMSVFIPALIENNTPIIGMCFGHQLIADVLGAPISVKESCAETGIAKISLTDDGKNDRLLKDMDDTFPAVVGHKVSVMELPDGATLLASSDDCEVHAFRYKDNVYGFQFHPELNEQTLADRLEMYPEYTNHTIDDYRDKNIDADKITKRAVKLFG
jgi:GMP synthase (glutamine-hydrolysing)